MKDKFYVTKGINESLDIRLVIYIQNLIATMEVEEKHSYWTLMFAHEY